MQAIKNYLDANPTLKSKVALTGSLSKAAIAKQMQVADFFVFPSRHESFGLVIAEAMACGLPVIVGNQTAPKEYVNKDCGLLIPPDDIDAMANAMQQLIDNLSAYKAGTIRRHVVSSFSFDVFGKRLRVIYQNEF
jgi:glycosyltransferase involved in cell wall biosynthesis